MIIKNINFPIFVKCGDGIIASLTDVLQAENLIFKRVSIVTSNFGCTLVEKLGLGNQFEQTNVFNLSEISDLSAIKSKVIEARSELIIAIGGGATIDIAKYVSMESTLPLISVPTVLSNDGIASPVSILKLNNENRSIGTTIPIGLLADMAILRKSPTRFLLSGLGDLLSNISAILDWELAAARGHGKVDFIAREISHNSSMKLLLSCDGYESIRSSDFLQDLFSGLVMSGISMILTNSSRPASGSEHNISHALDRLLKGKAKLHGIQVGFSTLLTLYLHGKEDLLASLIECYKRFGFPDSFKSFGIDQETFTKAVELAPGIRDRYTILNEATVGAGVLDSLYARS